MIDRMTASFGHYGAPAPKRKRIWPLVASAVLLAAVCGGCVIGSMVLIGSSGSIGVPVTGEGGSRATPGQEVADGDMRFRVERIEDRTTIGEEPFIHRAQGRYVIVSLTVTNVGRSATTFVTSLQKAFSRDGAEFSTSPEVEWILTPDAWVTQINPGQTMRGVIVFDVPGSTQLERVVLHSGMLSRGATVSLGG